MSLLLEKYVGLYGKLDALKGLSQDTAGGAYILSGEDADGLCLFSRLVAARLCGIEQERALNDFADIMVYPQSGVVKTTKSKKSGSAKEVEKRDMTVDDVKQIIDSLYLTPFELDRRVFIIENAETLSEICQNKLLKSLEEPPPRVTFLLCSTRALLPTVQSRCITIRLPAFELSTVRNALREVHGDDKGIELAARACRGSFGLAERILADKDFGDTYAAALKILRLATGSRAFGTTAAVYDKFSREKADGVLGVMEYLLGDISRLLAGAETVFDASDVKSASIGFTAYSAARSADFVRTAKRHNDGNCMVVAVMDELILKIMEEKALCQKS